jgi:hypothetical protein
MIFHRPRDKEGDLGIQGCDEGLRAIRIVNEAEGRIASAFYLPKRQNEVSLRGAPACGRQEATKQSHDFKSRLPRSDWPLAMTS